MQTGNQKKISVKIVLAKIVLFAFVLLLLFTYSSQESNNQSFDLQETAFLYEGNQLVGVNIDDRAQELVDAQANKAKEVTKESNSKSADTSLSTKVISTPSIVNFTLSDEEQIDTIDYAKQKTKVLEQGYTLSIDGKYKYYVKDKETIAWTIDKILLAYVPDQSYIEYYKTTGNFKPYTVGNNKFTGISISNDITISEGYTTGSIYVDEKEDLLFDLFHKDQNREYQLISDSDSIQSIQDDKDLSETEFKLNNPNISESAVTYNGQKIVTNKIDPVLDIVQTFETVKTEDIAYETVQEVDDEMLTGQFEVKNEGKDGEKEITYESKMVNGKVVSKEKVDEEVTIKPEHEVILVGEGTATNTVTVDGGTSELGEFSSSTASSSGYIWPSSSKSVTCEYMCYTNHTGIDIQSYYGGPIYAAKSGTVVTSGWSPYGYGYHVIIDHGNGMQTLYAHQKQQPPVSVGQYVQQGQVIGFEGATGRVTGEHLHFEVRINGSTVNPRGYIS